MTATKTQKLEIKKYNDKCYVLIGDSFHLRKILMSENLGIYNKKLTDSTTNEKFAAWVFANNKLDRIKELLTKSDAILSEHNVKLDLEYSKTSKVIISCLDAKKQKKNSIKHDLKTYLLEHLNELKETLGIVLNQKFEVKNDIDKNDKKTYIMIGECGFSYIRFDARNKNAKEIVNESLNLKKDIDDAIIKTFTKEELTHLNNIGCPIEAILFQNMTYKSKYNYLVKQFMLEKFNIKNVYVEDLID